jgi:hypothetical protein
LYLASGTSNFVHRRSESSSSAHAYSGITARLQAASICRPLRTVPTAVYSLKMSFEHPSSAPSEAQQKNDNPLTHP